MSERGLAERVGIEPTVPLPGQQFSRLPDSATLAPLRMVELISRQGRLGEDVSPLPLAVEAAYLGECDFSIGFLSASKSLARSIWFLWLVLSI
jgi:hypothetical protein